MSLGSNVGYNKYVPQPFTPWVDFYIPNVTGRKSLTRGDDDRPARLIDFEYVRKTDSAGNTFTIRLFDPEWSTLEPLLLRGLGDGRVVFRYYYMGESRSGAGSPKYACHILDYEPEFVVDGVIFTITGVSAGIIEGGQEAETQTWTGDKISDIVRDVAAKHPEWKILPDSIDETIRLDAWDSPTGSDPIPRKFRQNDMPDLQFLKGLISAAVRSSDGRGGYRLWFSDKEDRDGRRTLYFKVPGDAPAGGSGAGLRVFQFMRNDKYSEVISFRPEIRGTMFYASAGSAKTTNIDPGTMGKSMSSYVNPRGEILKNLGMGSPATIDNPLAAKEYLNPAVNKYFSEVAPNVQVNAAGQAVYNASATVLGDPDLEPMEHVIFVLREPNLIDEVGALHKVSGIYQILQITDSIGGGSFTSTLELIRVGDISERDIA